MQKTDVSVLWIRIQTGSGVNGVSGSGCRRAKMTHKNKKRVIKFNFSKDWMFSFES
jgi:hypothetical protein